jgi:hypothetical protein
MLVRNHIIDPVSDLTIFGIRKAEKKELDTAVFPVFLLSLINHLLHRRTSEKNWTWLTRCVITQLRAAGHTTIPC